MKNIAVEIGGMRDRVVERGKTAISGVREVGGKTKAAATVGVKEAAAVARETGNKAVVAVTDKAKELASEEQRRHQQRLRDKYNPVFLEELLSSDFDLPKMVVIKDEHSRRGIEVCKGSIGWADRSSIPEILYLYESAVRESGLALYPRVVCDSAYYADDPASESRRYVSIDRYFEEYHEARMNELGRIAFDLGAKECWVEMAETSKKTAGGKGAFGRKAGVNAGKQTEVGHGASVEADANATKVSDARIVYKRVFSGSDEPCRPELHWFANDNGIRSLVDMRCLGKAENRLGVQEVLIESNSSSVMSVSLAGKIDCALKESRVKANFGGNSSFEAKATAESKKRFCYKIVF